VIYVRRAMSTFNCSLFLVTAMQIAASRGLNCASCRGGWVERSCPRSATTIHSAAVDRSPNLPLEGRTLYYWAIAAQLHFLSSIGAGKEWNEQSMIRNLYVCLHNETPINIYLKRLVKICCLVWQNELHHFLWSFAITGRQSSKCFFLDSDTLRRRILWVSYDKYKQAELDVQSVNLRNRSCNDQQRKNRKIRSTALSLRL